MKRSIFLLCASCIILGTATPTLGSDEPLRKELKGLYAKLADSGKHKDVAAYMELNGPDYYVVLLNGDSLNRVQFENGMRHFFTSRLFVRQLDLDYKIRNVTPTADGAVVLVEQRDKRVQIQHDGKPHHVKSHVLHQDTWLRTAVGLRRSATLELRELKFRVDGSIEE